MENFNNLDLARTLLETYLGRSSGARVLDGQIKRGDGQSIDAVIWFSDPRESTPLSTRRAPPAFACGVGLHLGRVYYGNIGTPERLEFSVIGVAANKAARIEGLCKDTGQDVVLP